MKLKPSSVMARCSWTPTSDWLGCLSGSSIGLGLDLVWYGQKVIKTSLLTLTTCDLPSSSLEYINCRTWTHACNWSIAKQCKTKYVVIWTMILWGWAIRSGSWDPNSTFLGIMSFFVCRTVWYSQNLKDTNVPRPLFVAMDFREVFN